MVHVYSLTIRRVDLQSEWSVQPLDTSTAAIHKNEVTALKFLAGSRDHVY